MGRAAARDDHAAMDSKQLQRSERPAIRSFRICLAHPHRPTTLLGVIRRVAAEQAVAGQYRSRQVAAAQFPRRTSVFA
jgi:hypothetical protein